MCTRKCITFGVKMVKDVMIHPCRLWLFHILKTMAGNEMWRFFLYHRKHLESEGCHFNWPICDDMFVMVWVWTRVAIYHMFLRRWSIGWSLPCGECFDFKCVFWVYVNAFFFSKCVILWVENILSGTRTSHKSFYWVSVAWSQGLMWQATVAMIQN